MRGCFPFVGSFPTLLRSTAQTVGSLAVVLQNSQKDYTK